MALDPVLLLTAGTLAVDSWTAEACAALRRDGVDTLLLKGPVLAEWLYDRGEFRPYGDADLLVAGPDRDRAEGVLTRLGYRLRDPEGELRLISGPHAQAWSRESDRATIDLHHTLPGEVLAEGVVWPTLWERATRMDLVGVSVPVLDLPSRAVMVALHAFHHSVVDTMAQETPLEDLTRATERAPLSVWTEAVSVAEAIMALPQFAAGLRLVPAGTRLAQQLNLPSGDVLEDLGDHALAAGFERLANAPDTRTRMAIIRREVFPPVSFMHWWAPWSRGSRARLAAGYVYRGGWLMVHGVSGYRAWRRARQA